MLNLASIVSIMASILVVVDGEDSKIHPELKSLLETQGTANLLVSFKSGIKSTLERASSLRLADDRGQRNAALLDMLSDNADSSQADVIQLLSTRSGGSAQGFKSLTQFKSSNLMIVKEATMDTVQSIADDSQVSMIRLEPKFSLVPLQDAETEGTHPESLARRDDELGWNLEKMQVPQAWEELKGLKGDGVVVGTIDSGVQWEHEIYRDNFVGTEYGWFDAIDGKLEPYEGDLDTSHGTGTMGPLVGTHGIGVTPNAKWMTCVACRHGCEAEHLLKCIEWMECPTLPDGTNRNCSRAPHVVSNSWVSARGETGYDEFILRWREMGIIPVFAIGNQGPKCVTTQAPGEFPYAIGVGAMNKNDTISFFSAVGPSSDGGIKPDIVAPGERIRTAWDYGNDRYLHIQGTSAACPQVAGVIALLKVRDPQLSYDEAYSLITQTADHGLLLEGPPDDKYICNRTQSLDFYPNNFGGHGRINALEAVKAQTARLNRKK